MSLPVVPSGRDETLPQRPPVFYRKVRHRKAQLRSGPARPVAPPENGWLRRSVARKAEGEAHLRPARTPVPQLFREGGALEGAHRIEPDGDARAASRQRRVPHGTRRLTRASAAACASRPRAREGSQGEYSELPRSGGRRNHAEGQDARQRDDTGSPQPGAEPGYRSVARYRPREFQSARRRIAAPRRRTDAADERAADRRALFQVADSFTAIAKSKGL